MIYEDGPTAPPLEVTISRVEYDKIKQDIASLFDHHILLREVYTAVFLENRPVDELEDLKLRIQHFLRPGVVVI
jgi:hypothetical protein